ncbi:oligosaccharide flippase family protein, partial [Turicibacter sanguinis]|nr:oligosaccharide flippase family protein [Turicibacter sanguinis]
MRTSNSIKNSIIGTLTIFISMVTSFIAQAVFIRILSIDFLGLNGLFTNILSILSLFELGIGNAIIYNLYSPLAKKNKEEINSLMCFYKKSYHIIAILILICGVLILPFLNFIVRDVEVDINIYIVYILFLLSSVASYIISYKRSLIYADQKNYIINIIHMAYLIILNISQLLALYFTKNYYLYLIIKILYQLFENIVITVCANRLYPYLKDKKVKKLDKEIEQNIFLKIKALVFHKIGAVIINGTDNIIISAFFTIGIVGIYSNYYMIINAINIMFTQIISSCMASVGNLLVTSDKQNIYYTFRRIRFLNFWISSFSAISLLCMIQPFIIIWVGKEYLLGGEVVIILVFNYFQKMQRCTYSTFKDSAGIWQEDKYVPLIESFFNILFSIVCLKYFGLSGVFMGTIISGLVLWCYSYPRFVYKKLFNRHYLAYFVETLGYI